MTSVRRMRNMHLKPVQVFVGLAGLVVLLALGGCGQSKYTSVTGVVTLDGAPLANANVVFRAPGCPMSSARTDESGRFRVETGGARGMKPGEYAVTVAAFAPPKKEGGAPSPKLITPEKYVKPDESGLSAVIEEGTNTKLNFDLSTS